MTVGLARGHGVVVVAACLPFEPYQLLGGGPPLPGVVGLLEQEAGRLQEGVEVESRPRTTGPRENRGQRPHLGVHLVLQACDPALSRRHLRLGGAGGFHLATDLPGVRDARAGVAQVRPEGAPGSIGFLGRPGRRVQIAHHLGVR